MSAQTINLNWIIANQNYMVESLLNTISVSGDYIT